MNSGFQLLTVVAKFNVNIEFIIVCFSSFHTSFNGFTLYCVFRKADYLAIY